MSRETVVTDALVLTSADVRDDRIVHLLTRDHGRQPLVARRARKSTRRFGGDLQPLTHIHATMTLRPEQDLGLLDSAVARATFPTLKGELERFAFASVMVDVVTHLIPPHGHEPGVFDLLLRALMHLDSAPEADEDVLALFELRMLRGLGILPTWDEVAGLPRDAVEVLEGWLASRWAPLPPNVQGHTLGALEALIQAVSGRPLKSRAVLDDLLGR
ncbi:MAG: DNA repair protein RecO [Myxococcota bacterium]|nr:DNA repair protein RecO [Myxococcota bacterium]